MKYDFFGGGLDDDTDGKSRTKSASPKRDHWRATFNLFRSSICTRRFGLNQLGISRVYVFAVLKGLSSVIVRSGSRPQFPRKTCSRQLAVMVTLACPSPPRVRELSFLCVDFTSFSTLVVDGHCARDEDG